MNQNPQQLPKRSAIFINYRRVDTAGHTGRLFDRLSARFPGRVFRDIDTIQPGIDFTEAIKQALGGCEVLIVMIGNQWLTLADDKGNRRLDNENDLVRQEIKVALERDICTIPVLVEGAAIPRPADLPPDISKLVQRNAIELSDARWAFDVDRLIQRIEKVLQDRAPSALMPAMKVPVQPPVERERQRPRAGLVLALLVLVVLGIEQVISMQGQVQPTKPPLTSPAPEPKVEPVAPSSAKTGVKKPLRALKPVAAAPRPEPETAKPEKTKSRWRSVKEWGKSLFSKKNRDQDRQSG